MILSKTQIEVLCKAILGDKMAHNQLLTDDEGLFRFVLALKGDAKAIEWLLVNNKMLAAFDDAIGGNKSAIKLLLQKAPVLAAVANYLNGDENAITWLGQHGFSDYIKLAQSIKKLQEKESGKDVSFFYTP